MRGQLRESAKEFEELKESYKGVEVRFRWLKNQHRLDVQRSTNEALLRHDSQNKKLQELRRFLDQTLSGSDVESNSEYALYPYGFGMLLIDLI